MAAREEVAKIAANAPAFLAGLVDIEATGSPITLPNGTTVPRLPGYRRWLWDGEFCGSIGFRWQRGTEALPPYCLGHIGSSVVPSKQRRGYHVRQRTHEFGAGVRMAVGARAADIIRDVMVRGGRSALIGVVVGVVLAGGLAHLLRAFLLDVSPFDPFTSAAAAFLLISIALLASFVPARRATMVPPRVALQTD